MFWVTLFVHLLLLQVGRYLKPCRLVLLNLLLLFFEGLLLGGESELFRHRDLAYFPLDGSNSGSAFRSKLSILPHTFTIELVLDIEAIFVKGHVEYGSDFLHLLLLCLGQLLGTVPMK